MKPRVVFDTATVISALLFKDGRLAWLRTHWQSECTPLLGKDTVAELVRVLEYPKFQLTADDRQELLADYLPFGMVIAVATKCAVQCRDSKDQPFLNLAHAGNATCLVSGDRDLLALAGKTPFTIETPENYRLRAQSWILPSRNRLPSAGKK